MPGIIIFRALFDNDIVGMILWYVQNKIAYYHLSAYSDLGYELRASFGLFKHSIEYFQNLGLRSLNLGSGAGIKGSEADGLSRFKKGWSNLTRTSFFCGKIFNYEAYSEILEDKSISKTDYFPAYRVGEFN